MTLVKPKNSYVEYAPKPPSTKIAVLLSAVIPGGGQIYLGRLLIGLGSLILALLSFAGMLDYLDYDPAHPAWFYYWGIPALIVYLANWIFSVVHAYLKAQAPPRPDLFYRAVSYHLRQSQKAGMLIEALLWPFFLYSALGLMPDWKGALWIADNFRYWFIYELVGTLLFGLILALTDDFRASFGLKQRGELVCLVTLYALATMVGKWWLHLHFQQLLLAMLIILPGQFTEVLHASDNRRWELAQRGGFSIASFLVALPIVIVIMHFLEDPPYRLLSKTMAIEFLSMALAALYFFLRTVGETWYRHAFGYER